MEIPQSFTVGDLSFFGKPSDYQDFDILGYIDRFFQTRIERGFSLGLARMSKEEYESQLWEDALKERLIMETYTAYSK